METIKSARNKHGLNAREAVAFIRNRHCSRVSLTDSLAHAVDKAESYGTAESKIAKDLCSVGDSGDLSQYTRNFLPFQK